MIERYHLRYFLAVVDAGNFSRAAQQMRVTQPTLSIAIARLEEALGARLFFRNSKRVQLTERGARLLAHARTVESDFNALVDRVAEKGDQPLLRVGVLSSIPTRFIEQLVRGNADSPAPSALEIIEGTERDLHNRLARRRLDVALTLVRPGETGLPYEILFREGYAIAAPSNHPFAGLEAVSGEALRDDVMIVRRHCEVLAETSRYFIERGVRPRFSFRSTNDDRTITLVQAGLGVTLMPDCFRAEKLARPKLLGFNYTRDVGLVWASPPEDARGPAVDILRAFRG